MAAGMRGDGRVQRYARHVRYTLFITLTLTAGSDIALLEFVHNFLAQAAPPLRSEVAVGSEAFPGCRTEPECRV